MMQPMSTKPLNVWLVDDDSSIRWVLERALKQGGMVPTAFEQADSVLSALRRSRPDVLMTDIRMPGRSGLELLSEIRTSQPELPVIILTKRSPEMLGPAPAMQEVFRAIGRLSRSSMTVLINGESGTGKELVARALHRHSPRANKAFIALNTSAFTADLLESELFGHEKGSFTGADAQRRGRFEQADGGTLFLDEIGDMSPQLQTRLLRVLAEGEFYRVGGQIPVRVDVRVIAYDWPGHVRQLVNTCRRLTVSAPGREIKVADIPTDLGGVTNATGLQDEWSRQLTAWADKRLAEGGAPLLDDALPEFERTLIRCALRKTEGGRQEAAKLLGWGRNTLTRKLKELDMDDE